MSRIPDKRPGATKERRFRPYDPDFGQLFTNCAARRPNYGTRLAALEKRLQVDLTLLSDQLAGVLAQLTGLEAPAAPSSAPDPIWSMNEGYHSWACAIVYHADPRRAEVTFFFDDVEVGCHVLHARHEDMKTRLELFPIANVAVKASSSYTPEQYNTDDGRGHSGDMLIRDIAYYPAGFAMPPLAK